MKHSLLFTTVRPIQGIVAILWLFGFGMGIAHATTIDFEEYANGTLITDQYSGVTFTNAVEGTSTATMYADSVPSSGTGFLSNTDGVLQVVFDTPESSVSGFYTAYYGLTLNAYDVNGALLTSTDLAGNYGTHTAWSLSGLGEVGSVTFVAPSGTEAIDDLTYLPATTPTPEPGSLLLLGTGLMSGAAVCVQRAARAQAKAKV